MSLEQFYNDWYAHGYMDEWPAEKKERVYQLIRELPLPEKGRALDFGCGNGVFTDVLKKALPNWEVFGSDLSTLAVENAAKRFPDCRFMNGNSVELETLKFDFIFSHHVLEHVDDQEGTAAIIGNMATPTAKMLHILPCGNAGSLEHSICTWTKNGIQTDKKNTFFFEEEMHLQRFTSAQLTALFRPYGFQPVIGFYANQFYGGIQWISGMSKQFIQHLTSYRHGITGVSRLQLFFYRCLFICLYYLQRPYTFFIGRYRSNPASLGFIQKLMFYFSRMVKTIIDQRAQNEWRGSRLKENGSEMYLFFQRT